MNIYFTLYSYQLVQRCNRVQSTEYIVQSEGGGDLSLGWSLYIHKAMILLYTGNIIIQLV